MSKVYQRAFGGLSVLVVLLGAVLGALYPVQTTFGSIRDDPPLSPMTAGKRTLAGLWGLCFAGLATVAVHIVYARVTTGLWG